MGQGTDNVDATGSASRKEPTIASAPIVVRPAMPSAEDKANFSKPVSSADAQRQSLQRMTV